MEGWGLRCREVMELQVFWSDRTERQHCAVRRLLQLVKDRSPSSDKLLTTLSTRSKLLQATIPEIAPRTRTHTRTHEHAFVSQAHVFFFCIMPLVNFQSRSGLVWIHSCIATKLDQLEATLIVLVEQPKCCYWFTHCCAPRDRCRE